MTNANYKITFEDLKGTYWIFCNTAGHVATNFFRFNENGTIGGYHHDNERYWDIENGFVRLLNQNKHQTVIFDKIEIDDGLLVLTGAHLPNTSVYLCLKERKERYRFTDTKDALKNEIDTLGWRIGDHTYGIPSFVEKGLADLGMARLIIGKYCSIAGGVKISFGNHRTDFVTTYPFVSLSQYWEFAPHHVKDHQSKGDIVIGNDVWIGEDVFIGSGVTIGNGAILGSKAVVVKDVPPYAVAVGNPARVIRHRFSDAIIQQLEALAWWDLNDENVDSLLEYLLSADVHTFIEKLRELRQQLGDAAK